MLALAETAGGFAVKGQQVHPALAEKFNKNTKSSSPAKKNNAALQLTAGYRPQQNLNSYTNSQNGLIANRQVVVNNKSKLFLRVRAKW